MSSSDRSSSHSQPYTSSSFSSSSHSGSYGSSQSSGRRRGQSSSHRQGASNGGGASTHSRRRDYYAILKLSRDASYKQIKKAYHEAAKAWHPDKVKGTNREAKAERNMRLIARAWEVLGDEETKEAYDRGVDVDAETRRS